MHPWDHMARKQDPRGFRSFCFPGRLGQPCRPIPEQSVPRWGRAGDGRAGQGRAGQWTLEGADGSR